ncbi:MAG: SDR family NAD(P)-dependent oxidoreductase, partial [Pontixanthobacter sp.]
MTNSKAIFITGGGSGIGRAITQYFAGRGWFVGVGDIDTAGMDETLAAIPSDRCFAHKFDVRDRAAWDTALNAFAEAAGGRIDVLANNAGIPLGGAIDDNSTDEIERCLDIN